MDELPKVNIQLELPRDSETERDWKVRWIVFAVCVALTLLIPYEVFHYVGQVLDHPVIGGFIGAGIGVALLGFLMPRLLVYVPEWSAYVTQNPFGGAMIGYGPGTHASLPWEQRNARGNFWLGVITKVFTLTIPTQTSAVTVKGRVFYHASLRFITRAIGVDKEVVEEGLVSYISSHLTSKLGAKKAESVIKEAAQTSTELNGEFRDSPVGNPEEFEKKYGYSAASIVIDQISYSADVQKALDAVSEAEKLNDIAAKLLGISKEQMATLLEKRVLTMKQVKEVVDRALVASGNATMQLNVIEGDMANAVANFLTQQDKGGRK